MSHYYLASPGQLQEALETHCATWPDDQARIFKKLLQDFLDGAAAREHRVRVDVADPLPTPATIGPSKP